MTRWVVVASRIYGLQTEAVACLASLRARDCSPNTERVYAGRIALYLDYCLMRRPDAPIFHAMLLDLPWKPGNRAVRAGRAGRTGEGWSPVRHSIMPWQGVAVSGGAGVVDGAVDA